MSFLAASYVACRVMVRPEGRDSGVDWAERAAAAPPPDVDSPCPLPDPLNSGGMNSAASTTTTTRPPATATLNQTDLPVEGAAGMISGTSTTGRDLVAPPSCV